MLRNKIKQVLELFNLGFIYYNGAIIRYKKYVSEEGINVKVKLVYIVAYQQYIINEENYQLNKNTTLKSLISSYKIIVDEFNRLSKNNIKDEQ